MSSNHNDSNNMIHLGNYEEYFILYMDNELSVEEKKMVEDFLEAHPDLRAELDILLSTKLPADELHIDKESLMADQMKLTLINEELLLYVDEELEAPRKKELEKSIASDKDLQLQHQLLLKTKLDPSEIIAYPNKAELYRRTDRVVVFRPWMRMAAAAVILAATAGIFYYSGSGTDTGTATANAGTKTVSPKTETPVNTEYSNPVNTPEQKPEGAGNLVADKNTLPAAIPSGHQGDHVPQPVRTDGVIVYQDVQPNHIPDATLENNLERADQPIQSVAIARLHKETLNNPDVTSSLPERITTIAAADAASIENKGSVKGFLRKATRLFEKRTGIDPTNENGELLIGVIAVKLK